ncbi:hypothetical protein NQ176_g1761 [Zarea fungicola]|uniref:Uncharacterized protein n=1 Tax=Zarea fungicola TaxID=93591 RepID=A0ACC1NSH4_9HYPO|nr:hypothetical protein NQ176_g1761 [Lecanicillium fungicola]
MLKTELVRRRNDPMCRVSGLGLPRQRPAAPLVAWESPSASHAPLAAQPRTVVGPSEVKVNLSDMTMFDALRFNIVGLVAGGFDHSFWTVDVLRACQVQPAIWHASLALTALHQSQKQDAGETFRRSRHEKLSMTHYNASIKHVIALTRKRNLSNAEREALLLSSLLLTALCTMQGDVRQAMMHAVNCVQVFHQWRLWESHRSSVSRRGSMLNADSLNTIVAHIELQLVSRIEQVAIPPWGSPCSPPRCSDIPFASVTEAYQEFQPLFTSLIGLWQRAGLPLLQGLPQPGPEMDVRYPYVIEFQRWKKKYDALCASDRTSPLDAESMLTLYFYWELLEIIRTSKDVGKADGRPPAFSFTVSAVEGLMWSANGCRDPEVRRGFLELIQVWPRREGIWSNTLIAAIVETTIDLEETGWRDGEPDAGSDCVCVAGSFICNQHRVNNHTVEFLSGDRARVTFETVGDKMMNKRGHVAILP